MNEQEKMDTFNRDVDNLLKGEPAQQNLDPQRLDAARQLAAVDFSARSRARATTRARLLARANRELPVQNKRKEMNTRFSNVLRTLAFGAFLLMIVFGLGWVLSNTTPQLGLGLETPGAEGTEIAPPVVPVGAGEVYLVLDGNNASNPGFVHLPADCLVENMTCPTPETVANVPQGSLNTSFEWSPDFSKVISIFTYFEPQVWMFDRNEQIWAQMNTPLFSNPFWSPDGSWLVGMSSAKVNPTSNALLLARADGSEWQEILTDFQGVQIPIGWTDPNHVLFVQTYQDTNSVVHNDLRQYEIGTSAVSTIRELAPVNVLTRENSRLSGIDLSPDKSQIVYTFVSIGDEPKETEIASLNLVTGEQSTVTVDGTWTDITWSPDGKKFSITTGMNPALTCQVQIGDIGSRYIFTGSWAGNCDATWSPDGQYVVIPAPAQENKTVLYLFDVSDNATRQIEIPGVGVQDVLPRVSWIPELGVQTQEEPAIAFPRKGATEDLMEALMIGRLVLVDRCLRIEDSISNTSLLVIWPYDFNWQMTNGVVEVLDGTGQVVARVGDEISVSGGELDALAGLGKGNPIQDEIPEACPGPYWFSSSIVQPVTAEPTSETAITDFPLTLASDSETIRQRILLSHTFWQALWADAQITDYVSGTPAVQRVQVWVNQPAQARAVSGPMDGTPATLWISDGQMTRTGEDLSGYGLENFVPPMTESDTVYPHPMTGIMPTQLSSLLFPSGLAQRGGTYRPIAIETLAGRETLVVEWNRPDGPLVDRFWVDTVTGVILHQQNYGKGGDGALTYDYLISNIQFDLTFHPETFNRLAAFPPAFATGPEDIFTEVATPMPEGEADTSLASGEIYLGLQNPASYFGIKYLGHFPASCLISGEPCPPVEFLADVPAGLEFPMGWSPDYQQAIFPVSDFEEQMWRFQRDTQTWNLLEMPYMSGVIWSPDGQWMVGQPILGGGQESSPLMLSNANGIDWDEIMANLPGMKYAVAWLDETRFLILNNLDSITSEEDTTIYDEFQIYNTVSAETEVVTGIEWDIFSSNLELSVSPDGTQLIYSLTQRNSNTSTLTWVNLNDKSKNSFNLPVSIWGLSWSPDGEWLTLTAYVGSSCELHLVRPDGSDLHQIFPGEWQGACSNIWSPDSQYLLVPALAQTPTIPRLYVITVATGESRLVELPDVGVEFEWPVVSWVP